MIEDYTKKSPYDKTQESPTIENQEEKIEDELSRKLELEKKLAEKFNKYSPGKHRKAS
jgi:uncharacterized protein YdeI (YjbR/CyaY-like superfamily)